MTVELEDLMSHRVVLIQVQELCRLHLPLLLLLPVQFQHLPPLQKGAQIPLGHQPCHCRGLAVLLALLRLDLLNHSLY